MVAVRAHVFRVQERALGVRGLLHLPRVAGRDGRLSRTQVSDELTACARLLREATREVRSLIPLRTVALPDLEFRPLDQGSADRIFTHLHYLRSARPGSLNFGLVDPRTDLAVALCSVSPLEWQRVGTKLRSEFRVDPGTAWDVSRVYAFGVAPPNSISYLLARVRDHFRRELPAVNALVTAVDPNLGFTGASYRAANWQAWLRVEARPYLYHKQQYASPRQIRERFETSNFQTLRTQHPGDFQQSWTALEDSLIFCCRTRGITEAVAEPLALRR